MHGQLSMRMRCLRPGSRRRCPLLGGDLAAFCASLVEGLAHLESTLEVDLDHGRGGGSVGSGSVSMRWCADAMRLVKRMQREMLAIFRKADVPAAAAVSSRGGGAAGAGDWFEHYMQETAALLDFCNAFKAAVSRMHRYCMVVDFAAQVGGAAGDDDGAGAAAASLVVESAAEPTGSRQASSAAAAVRDKIAEVKAAVTEAERLGRTIISGGAGGDGGGMVVVTLVAKITTSVLAMFVLQALVSPAPLDDGAVRPTLASAVDVPELEPWCESLSLIHARFPSRATVAEHEKVATVVRDLISGKPGGGGHGGQQEEVARGHVELLRARSGELREGVEMFACVLDEVFDEVIRGRNEMLGILRDKTLT
ncbi:hypothetical protein PAHAL_8G059100 [Panicum hallii]|jgi:hypothetical protein|uniref:Uncharacterized protein n=1 Tax=Panicum hallii TaxID=206008 RepID=A0A2S3ID26_9POAL|nr:uncharacterized protein LOC112902603 [Panicum hallii]PAN41648.1 hypothetical protein PAHAL_8G059100 [Panicum hallii]